MGYLFYVLCYQLWPYFYVRILSYLLGHFFLPLVLWYGRFLSLPSYFHSGFSLALNLLVDFPLGVLWILCLFVSLLFSYVVELLIYLSHSPPHILGEVCASSLVCPICLTLLSLLTLTLTRVIIQVFFFYRPRSSFCNQTVGNFYYVLLLPLMLVLGVCL